MKQFVKALSSDGDTFQHIRSMFPKLPTDKFEGGIFVGPQVKKMLNEVINEEMPLKLHYLHSHLDVFHKNVGDLTKEHGEGFHKDTMQMEKVI